MTGQVDPMFCCDLFRFLDALALGSSHLVTTMQKIVGFVSDLWSALYHVINDRRRRCTRHSHGTPIDGLDLLANLLQDLPQARRPIRDDKVGLTYFDTAFTPRGKRNRNTNGVPKQSVADDVPMLGVHRMCESNNLFLR